MSRTNQMNRPGCGESSVCPFGVTECIPANGHLLIHKNERAYLITDSDEKERPRRKGLDQDHRKRVIFKKVEIRQ